eukprot:4171017-Ditylum_brightwellii.AAC.1
MTSMQQHPDLYTHSELEFSINSHSGMFKQGKTYPLQKKIEVTQKYKSLKEQYGKVSAQTLVKEAGDRKDYARKIKREVDKEGLACPNRRANQIVGNKDVCFKEPHP